MIKDVDDVNKTNEGDDNGGDSFDGGYDGFISEDVVDKGKQIMNYQEEAEFDYNILHKLKGNVWTKKLPVVSCSRISCQ